MWLRHKQQLSLKQAIVLTAVWILCLLFISVIADYLLPYKPSFPYADSILAQSVLPRFIYSFANFDGVHYITIATRGYHAAALIQAFFPVFPGVLAFFYGVSLSPIMAGLVFNWICLAVLLYSFGQLIQPYLKTDEQLRSILWVLLFPTSFFFAMLYTEALFLLLIVCAFWAAEKKRWGLVALVTVVASATRLVGVFLVPALILQYWLSQTDHSSWQIWRKRTSVLPVFLICLGAGGLLVYMLYLQISFGDPLLFAHVQSEFGAGREESVVLLPQTIWRSIRILITVTPSLKWWSYLQDLFMTLLTLSVLLLGTVRSKEWTKVFSRVLGDWERYLVWVPQLPIGWYVFSWAAVLLPTATGTLSSMPRYVLVALPLFVILASMPLPKWAHVLVYGASVCMLVLNTVLYIQGYWVA